MQSSADINELAAALAKAQAEFPAAKKTATNPHLKNKYATLGDVFEAVRGVLAKHNLSVVQGGSAGDSGGFELETRLIHASGQWIAGRMWFSAGNKIQEHGSHLTYARRYGLSALLGIVADDDDDGNAASGTKPPAAPATRKVEAPAAATDEFDTVLPSTNPLLKKYAGKRIRDLTITEANDVVSKVTATALKAILTRYLASKAGIDAATVAEHELEATKP